MTKEYYETNKEAIKAQHHEYYMLHKTEFIEKAKKWVENNQEKRKKSVKNYNLTHKKDKLDYQKKWRKTKYGRATMLLSAYKQADKNTKRGECTLTSQWIVENIFTKPCAHCGETDWRKIGCNRLDNSKPHTPDNVEPCCLNCNLKLEHNNRNNLGQFTS